MRNQNKLLIIISLAFGILFPLACQPKTVSSEEPANRPVAEPTPRSNDSITIAAVGDIMMGSSFPNDSRMPPNDGADLLRGVTHILSAADIAFGNLEGPIVDGGVSVSYTHLRAHETL